MTELCGFMPVLDFPEYRSEKSVYYLLIIKYVVVNYLESSVKVQG